MANTTDLGKWMLTNGGEYNPETAYEQLTMVMYENSTYITLKTVQGITPTDDHVNYQLMAKGFNPTALASVQAEDTSGVLGEVGGTVSAQDLVDWVVDQAATKLLKISDLVSVQTNDATKAASAALAYAMGQEINQLNSDLDKISNKSIRFTEGYNVLTSTGSYTVLEDGYIQSRNASEEISTTNPVVRVLINNTTVIENTGISGTYKYFTSAFFPVKVGDIIKLTQATYSKRNEIKLFPIK